jgi:hypothetical protein
MTAIFLPPPRPADVARAELLPEGKRGGCGAAAEGSEER